ncbi:hypothetical protein Salat_1970400 [Sesamum alatum]|uniref:Uncharacterized protein n=1 Tax=Sesamum alatum TaxID=300844 RepID=A0AAE2CIY5_9LAMI|nr:hypothetical protein Salat_1970400 [Sesamum alatum]
MPTLLYSAAAHQQILGRGSSFNNWIRQGRKCWNSRCFWFFLANDTNTRMHLQSWDRLIDNFVINAAAEKSIGTVCWLIFPIFCLGIIVGSVSISSSSSSVLDSESQRRKDLQDETISSVLRTTKGCMCIARPNVFKRPHESILSADDILLPGNKYFIIRSTTVEKIKRRHSGKGRINEPANNGKPIPESKEIEGVAMIILMILFCSGTSSSLEKVGPFCETC